MSLSSKDKVSVFIPKDLSGEISAPKEVSFQRNDFLLNNENFQIDSRVATRMGLFEAQSKEEKRAFDAEVLKYVQAIKDDAYEEAFKKGQEEGVRVAKEEALKAAEEQIKERLEAVAKTLKSLEKYRERMYEQNEAEIVRFCYYIAEKIVLKEVANDRDFIVSVMKKIIPEEQSCVVRLSLKDFEFTQTHLHLIGKSIDLDYIKFESDESLSDGDVVLETPNGTLDGSLKTRLGKLKASIENME